VFARGATLPCATIAPPTGGVSFEGQTMAKGQMKPAKEKKKPKQVKPAAGAAGGKGAAPKK
jgi:hypothetical protein